MADFNPPWANGADRREPTGAEQDGGFQCGPADMALFNWLNWATQSEINKVIMQAGLVPSNSDMTQLYQAIQALIAAATGGGDVSNYVLMTQARARLPIFPEVQNAQFHFGVITPGTGQIRVPAGVTFLHRGIFPITSVQTDFATDPSKTYHLRWNPTDGFSLKDLTSGVYNPSTLAETVANFDSTYDDMLVARVITNSSNVPTITNLINKNLITASGEAVGPRGSLGPYAIQDGTLPSNITQYTAVNVNFARTPQAFLTAWNDLNTTVSTNKDYNVGVRPLNRYQVAVWGQGDIDIMVGWAARA